ncbi:MAG: hypothetical protein ABIF19_06100 [Planctomycetota bacterium]
MDSNKQARTDSDNSAEAVATTNSLKADHAKSEGSKGLQKISLGDNEDLYITADDQLWSVSKQPDGSTVKIQVQVDETTGEMTIKHRRPAVPQGDVILAATVLPENRTAL